MTEPRVAEARSRFADLHSAGTFVMPNVWDVGSARLFESLGFGAIATTSSGFAASLGRHDQNVTLPELVEHTAQICDAVHIPVSVDSEDGFADGPVGLAETVERLAEAGAAGISIEDYRPGQGVLGIEEAAERVASFTVAAASFGMTVTARAENHLYRTGDLEDTIARLRSYQTAGANVLYAPGVAGARDLRLLVGALERPVNVLLLPSGPDASRLREIGARRISTGGTLAFAAYGAAARAGRDLLGEGPVGFWDDVLTGQDRARAFGPP